MADTGDTVVNPIGVSVLKRRLRFKSASLIKPKSFHTAKETISKMKRQPTDWEKMFANDVTDKGSISKLHQRLIQLNIQKPNMIEKWAEDRNRHFPRKTNRRPTGT